MTAPHLIGISQRSSECGPHLELRDCLSHDWYKLVSRITPEVIFFPLPNDPDRISYIMAQLPLKGVILSGGNDWGESEDRDRTEVSVVDHCVRKGIPLLGVCRGLQVINKYYGGQIVEDLEKDTAEVHVGVSHSVRIDSREFLKLNNGETSLEVNSFHQQGVRLEDLGDGCEVFASTASGVVEGLYLSGGKTVAVQWHPERRNDCAADFDERLIRMLFDLGK